MTSSEQTAGELLAVARLLRGIALRYGAELNLDHVSVTLPGEIHRVAMRAVAEQFCTYSDHDTSLEAKILGVRFVPGKL